MLGPDQPVDPPAARDHAGPRRAPRRGHGARRLRLPAARRHRRRPTTPTWRSATSTSPCSSAPCPARGMERKDLLDGQRRHLQPSGQGARPTTAAKDVKILVVGNPANTNALIAMNNAAGPRPRPVHRHDPPRPQPGHGPAGRQDRRDRHRHHQDDDLGQPLGHPVPRPLPRRGRRQERRRAGRRPGLARERLHPDRASSGAPPSSRPAALLGAPRPPTPRSTTCTTGALGTPEGDWVSMAIPSDGSYGVPEGLISSFPVHLHGRRVLDRPGSRHRRLLPGAASTPRSPSWPRSATPSRSSA